jgi:radical SAM superfamily enzyme YgiQ (UPF0313 family)
MRRLSRHGRERIAPAARVIAANGDRPDFRDLVDHGEPPRRHPGGPRVGLLNANPFAKGIANLGFQCVATYLDDHGVEVHVAFADTVHGDAFFLDRPAPEPRACDVIAISVPFEDTYLNVPRLLRRAGLPVHARDRDATMPLVVAGGMAMINPVPLQDFVDVVVVGEGREALLEIVERLERHGSFRNRQDRLAEIADVPGTYVPSDYHVTLDANGLVDEFRAPRGREVVVARPPLDLTAHPVYSHWTSRHACYEHDDYFSLMVALGCQKKCPFCVVGHVQGERAGRALNISGRRVVELAEERRERYGTRLVKLFFSSAFSQGGDDINAESVKGLLEDLATRSFQARVGSLNVKQADADLFRLLHAHGQTSVAFAPETAESLRASIHKGYITDDKLREISHIAGSLGMDVNLYMLGGVPGETDEDTARQAELIRSVRKVMPRDRLLLVHYNPAFMKAQTPFQRFGCVRPREIRRRFRLLRNGIGDLAGVDFVTVIDDPMCYYQPVLALGDGDAGRVISLLSTKPEVREDDWKRAFRELGIDDSRYFETKSPTGRLPWEHISYVDHGKLTRRFRSYRARQAAATDAVR